VAYRDDFRAHAARRARDRLLLWLAARFERSQRHRRRNAIASGAAIAVVALFATLSSAALSTAQGDARAKISGADRPDDEHEDGRPPSRPSAAVNAIDDVDAAQARAAAIRAAYVCDLPISPAARSARPLQTWQGHRRARVDR